MIKTSDLPLMMSVTELRMERVEGQVCRLKVCVHVCVHVCYRYNDEKRKSACQHAQGGITDGAIRGGGSESG